VRAPPRSRVPRCRRSGCGPRPRQQAARRLHEGADPAGSARGDDVSGTQRDGLGGHRDQARDREGHVVGVRVLAQFAVDPRPDAQGLGIGHLVARHHDGPHRREAVEALGPRPLAVVALQVPGRDVVEDRVPEDVVEGRRLGDATATPADHERQFAFVVHLGGDGPGRDRRAVARQAGRQLGEEHRHVGRVPTLLGAVGAVVQAHGEDGPGVGHGRQVRDGRSRHDRQADGIGREGRVDQGAQAGIARLPGLDEGNARRGAGPAEGRRHRREVHQALGPDQGRNRSAADPNRRKSHEKPPGFRGTVARAEAPGCLRDPR